MAPAKYAANYGSVAVRVSRSCEGMRHEATASGPTPARACSVCGVAIGVYEPVVFEFPDGARTTSLAADPAAARDALGARHLNCQAP
jgi:hypothetical protein